MSLLTDLLKTTGVSHWLPGGGYGRATAGGILMNDIHSQLNATRVREVVYPGKVGEIQQAIDRARSEGRSLCMAGTRHAMGAQQFATDALLLDTSRLNRMLNLEAKHLSASLLLFLMLLSQKGRELLPGILR